MRLFIGVNINSRSKNLIEKKLEILKNEYNDDFKWVKKENWHLTLKFIGNALDREKQNLIRVLKNIEINCTDKYLQFNKVDAFPSLNKAEVIYLSLAQGRPLLKKLHQKLEEELIKYDFERDKREFIPHLTLGRSKNEALKIKKRFRTDNFINIYGKIESVSLYKSELKASGPEYIELFSIK
ncbi:MAG: RNA 2',3'-cyclic phosphodiesterase [Halanaerobium sp.]